MGNPFLSARFVPLILLAGTFLSAGCSDSDYDFGNIDSTVGLGGNMLELPASSTENIKLHDVLELEANGCVVETANGDYVFRQQGGQVAAAHPLIDKIVVKEESRPEIIPVEVRLKVSDVRAGMRRSSAAVAEASGNIFEFHYHGDKPDEVKELTEAEMTGNVTLTLKFPSRLNSLVPYLQNLVLRLPEYMGAEDRGSSQTPVVAANVLSFSNVPTSRDLVVKINIKTLDFTKTDAVPGNSISQQGSSVKLNGFVGMTASGAVTGAPTGGSQDLGHITGVFESSQFTINVATGRFSPSITLDNLGDVMISGVPDFLKEGNVVADLYNPQISLDVSNDMQVSGIASGVITAVKDGRTTASVAVDGIRLEGGKTSHVCICRRADGVEGYDQVIVKDNLSELVKTIPDRITFTASATADDRQKGRLELGHSYTVQPSYSVDAPIAFAENAVIEYRDTLDGWHDDIKRLKLADDAYIQATANVENRVPAYLSLNVIPVDAGKKPVDGIAVQLVKSRVEASADGLQPATSPLEVRLLQTADDALERLDGLVMVVTGKADSGEGNSVTGITLNAQTHTLRLTGLKIKVVGKIIGEFN